MIDLPDYFPMYCIDLMQMIDQEGLSKQDIIDALPQDNEHNAIEDAKWNKRLHEFLLNTKEFN